MRYDSEMGTAKPTRYTWGAQPFYYYRPYYIYSFEVRPPVNLILLDFRKFFKK